jgi:hypothetical protein
MIDQNVQHKITKIVVDGFDTNSWQCTCGAICHPDVQASRQLHLDSVIKRGGSLTKKLIYLASPHSHTSSGVREDRYKMALECTSWLIARGFWVFSPIVHSHNLPLNKNINNIKWEFWREFDTETITRCDEVWVLDIPGTWESKGVRAEIDIAKLQGKMVFVIKPVILTTFPELKNYHIEEID